MEIDKNIYRRIIGMTVFRTYLLLFLSIIYARNSVGTWLYV